MGLDRGHWLASFAADPSLPDHRLVPADYLVMPNAKQLAAMITQSALATLVQIPGIPQAELEAYARAIGNNAAQVIAAELEAEDAP